MARRPNKPVGPISTAIRDTVLIGTITVVVAIVGVTLSYNANSGLPFVSTYDISVDVPDAAELVKDDVVKLGGERVGNVESIRAIPPRRGRPPFARLKLKLQKRLQEIPADSRVEIRPLSILGSKYVSLTLGRSRTTIPPGGTLPLRQATPATELSESFQIFDKPTQAGLRAAVGGLGDALAGRGTSVNEAVASARQAIGPLSRVSQLLAAPRTDLPGFIAGAHGATAALAPVARPLGALVGHADRTLGAVDAAGAALDQTLEELPPTERTATDALGAMAPVLARAARLVRTLGPGTRLLPTASRRLDTAVRTVTPVLTRRPGPEELVSSLTRVLRVFVANRSVYSDSLRQLNLTVLSVGRVLEVLGPLQTRCNMLAIGARNLNSLLSVGDSDGSWVSVYLMPVPNQLAQSPEPASDLHVNFYHHENASECEAGNEPYLPGRQFGNPPGDQSTRTESTAPPAEATELARQAGLLSSITGGGR